MQVLQVTEAMGRACSCAAKKKSRQSAHSAHSACHFRTRCGVQKQKARHEAGLNWFGKSRRGREITKLRTSCLSPPMTDESEKMMVARATASPTTRVYRASHSRVAPPTLPRL